jgi:hypothetical protein
MIDTILSMINGMNRPNESLYMKGRYLRYLYSSTKTSKGLGTSDTLVVSNLVFQMISYHPINNKEVEHGQFKGFTWKIT